MKIILVSIGTRGDMEPFLAIGEILKEKGHQVICAFPEQFRNLAEESNIEFASLGTKFIQMLESEVGKAAMGGGGSSLTKFLANVKLASKQTEINKELVNKQYEIIESENPDRVVYNGKATYPIIWGLDKGRKAILVCPLPYMHYVRDHAHVAFNSDFGPLLNKLTYSLVDFGVITTVKISANWLKLSGKITRKQIKKALLSNKAIYTVSPSLFSRPDYWKENLQVVGYHERKKTTNWRPGEELNDFLEKHDRILFIAFGSMTNPDPEQKSKIIIDILERNQIPAIINTASGGLIRPDKLTSERIHFVSEIPYHWIFPKIYGVIHHGGSGTTHLALKYGCATMIIPHIIDQFVWNKIIYELGAGPKGIKVDKITTKNLEPKILELVNNRAFKKKAEQIASQMGKEDLREEVYQSIIEIGSH
jgi:sterol 3beta-glucosyltransferase